MSYKSCPSCGNAPSPDRTCKVCGRSGPSTAITQAELDEINARVVELKRLLDDAKPPEPPVYFYGPWVSLSSKPFSDGPRLPLLPPVWTPSDDEIAEMLRRKEGDE